MKLTLYKASLYLLEGRWIQVTLLFAISVTLLGCSWLTGGSAGPIEETVLTTIAGAGAAIDYMLAENILPPEMAEKLAGWFEATNSSLTQAQEAITTVRENSLTVEEATYGASGTVAGVLGLIRMWRGGSSKGPIKAVVGALKRTLGEAKETQGTQATE